MNVDDYGQIYKTLDDVQMIYDRSQLHPEFQLTEPREIGKNQTITNINIFKDYQLKFTIKLDEKMLKSRDFQRSILQIGWSIIDTIFGFNLKEGTDSNIKIKNSMNKLHEVVIDVNLPFDEDIEFEYISQHNTVFLIMNSKLL